jgi:hypothetical protein
VETIYIIIAALLFFLYFSITVMFNRIRPAKGFNTEIQKMPNHQLTDKNVKSLTQLSFNDHSFEALTGYFFNAAYYYSNDTRSLINYPGSAGTRGRLVEGLEGFARISTMLASWISVSNNKPLKEQNGKLIDVKKYLVEGIANGTDPKSKGYWGEFEKNDQRIVESADVAISLYLLMKSYELNKQESYNAARWLKQINEVQSYEGNWLLFRVIVNLVLVKLDKKNELMYLSFAQKSWYKFKDYHVGNGWFTDGKFGYIDYYNVWQMQYMLLWIFKIDNTFDNIFIKNCLDDFSKDYRYFISPKGVPIFGRSCCYRYAAAVPFICKALATKNIFDLKFAHRANQAIWGYYSEHDGLNNGCMTQGYLEEDVDLLENYSGRASSLWGLRSLSLSLLAFHGSSISSEDVKLPIEENNFHRNLPHIGFSIEGRRKTGEILITIDKNIANEYSLFRRRFWFIKILERLLSRPLRVENFEAKYKNPTYSNLFLFFKKKH